MKKNVNGQLVEMTAEEIAEYENLNDLSPEPTPEEKIAELEKQVTDLSTTLVNQI